MDESAIRLIQATAIAANNDTLARLPLGTLALPDNYKIHSLEKFMPWRERRRGTFATNSIDAFAEYTKAVVADSHAPGVQGFVSPHRFSAEMLFNMSNPDGTPGHCDYKATLSLDYTAAYEGLISNCGRPLSQRDLINFIEDWRDSFAMFVNDDDAAVSFAGAVTAIREVKIRARRESTHTDDDRKRARTAMEEVEHAATPSMPNYFVFSCPPAYGLPAQPYKVRISVLTDGNDEPQLKLRIIGESKLKEEALKGFKDILSDKLGSQAPLSIGTFTP